MSLPLLLLAFWAPQAPPPSPAPVQTEEPTWTGKADFGMSLLTGNNPTSKVDFQGKAQWERENRRWIGTGNYHASRQGTLLGESETSSRLMHLGVEHHRFLDADGDWYAYGKSSSRRDVPNGLELRADIGLGMGWEHRWNQDQTILTLEAGPSLLREDNVGSSKTDTLSGRSALTFKLPIAEKWTLETKAEYFFATGNTDANSLTSSVDMDWNFSEDWFLSFGNALAWDGTPAPGFQETDLRWTVNIGTTF
ncbi:MAG: DUF481 domain-containing protein [Planctomycetota bacterium]|nr:DUF481 domain-containing protein [Planctomycetota bacterium]